MAGQARPSITTTPMTLEEFRALPESMLKPEYIHGELVVAATPTSFLNDLVLEVALSLCTFVTGGKVHIAPKDVYIGEHVLQSNMS